MVTVVMQGTLDPFFNEKNPNKKCQFLLYQLYPSCTLEFILVGMDVLLIAMDEMGRLTSRMDNKRDVTRSEVLIIFPS